MSARPGRPNEVSSAVAVLDRAGATRLSPKAAEISIIIPTQRRPAGLAVAARSTFRQAGVDLSRLELVIVDNDQIPSARPLAEALARESPFPVRYVHEAAAGVSNARNAGLAASSGALIAFLDDDEEAADGWLAALLDAQRRFQADAVFGPVRGRAPAHIRDHRAYLETSFSRLGPAEAGITRHYFGCGDSLVRRAALPHPTRPFSASRNQTGGEDDKLFGEMQAAGARFAWAPDAVAFEDPVPERLNLRYTLARAFTYGQGPPRACADRAPADGLGAAGWMAVGLGQAAVFAPVAAVKWLLRTPDRAAALDRVVRGLGKVFWWGPFRMNFYGRAVAGTRAQPADGKGGRPRSISG